MHTAEHTRVSLVGRIQLAEFCVKWIWKESPDQTDQCQLTIPFLHLEGGTNTIVWLLLEQNLLQSADQTLPLDIAVV